MRYRKFDSKKLAFLLAKDSLTYQDMARNVGVIVGQEVVASTVRRHILGISEPNLKYLAAYADFFCVPIDYFFDGLLG